MPFSQSALFIKLAFKWLFRFGSFLAAPPNFFQKERRKKITGCVSWLLVRRVCAASKKQEHIIQQTTERCFVIEKVFSFKERAERIGKY